MSKTKKHERVWFLVAENETLLSDRFYPTAKAAEEALKKGQAKFEPMNYPKMSAYAQSTREFSRRRRVERA